MIFTLQPGIGVALPAQLLTLRVQALGSGALPELAAAVVRSDGTDHEVADVVRHPGMLVLAVQEPSVVRIRPPSGRSAFSSSSQFSLVVGPDSADGDRAMLKSIDVSGLRSCDLVTLNPAGSEIVVTAVAQVAPVVLPPLAARARVAARELVGAIQAPAAQCVAVRLVIDSSASLRPRLAEGWVAVAVELLSGVATVISSTASLPAIACGRTRVALADHRFDQTATALVEEVADLSPSIGFRSSLVPDGGGHGLTYVITDARPADLDIERLDLLHLVLLGADLPGGTGPEGNAVTVIDVSGEPSTVSDGQTTDAVRSLLSAYLRRLDGEGQALT